MSKKDVINKAKSMQMLFKMTIVLAIISGMGTLQSAYASLPTDPIFSMQSETSNDALTTEMFWRVDSEEKNPHRKTWGMNRTYAFIGNEIIKNEKTHLYRSVKGNVRVRLENFYRAKTKMFSALGPWACGTSIKDFYSTEKGAHVAGEKALELFQEKVNEEKEKLFALIEREKAEDAATMEMKIKHLFSAWTDEIESLYHSKILKQAREAEVKYYQAEAKNAGLCTKVGLKSSNAAESQLRWENFMDEPPISDTDLVHRKAMARIPARRLNGLYVVRLSANVYGNKILGQFMVDTSAPTSIASPIWFKNQGVKKDVLIPGKDSMGQFRWVGGSKKTGIVKLPMVSMGGIPIALSDFAVFETEVYTPLKSLIPCCDGALGIDFFKQYVVQFRPFNPGSMILWPRREFSLPSTDFDWVEASLSDSSKWSGQMESLCHLQVGNNEIPLRVFWSMADEGALTPLENGTAMKAVDNADLFCGDKKIASGIQQVPAHSSNNPVPVSIGMLILGRDEVVLDLPHGRVWFEKKGLFAQIPHDRSGLVVHYTMDDYGARKLLVTKVLKKTPAAKLTTLKTGSQITKINAEAVEEMTLWDVEQYLSGMRGKEVTLEWRVGEDLKVAPIELSDSL